MTTTVKKRRNNLDVLFPMQIWNAPKHRSTRERIVEYFNMTNIDNAENPAIEIDWGAPQGKEIW